MSVTVGSKVKTFFDLNLTCSHKGNVASTMNTINEFNIDLLDFQRYLQSKGHDVKLHDFNIDITEEIDEDDEE